MVGRATVAGVAITFVPARHWSRRRVGDINRSAWGGFVLEGRGATLYHAGDTGWFDGFAAIAARFPKIDLALLPIGAYAPAWFIEPHHMNPESKRSTPVLSWARARWSRCTGERSSSRTSRSKNRSSGCDGRGRSAVPTRASGCSPSARPPHSTHSGSEIVPPRHPGLQGNKSPNGELSWSSRVVEARVEIKASTKRPPRRLPDPRSPPGAALRTPQFSRNCDETQAFFTFTISEPLWGVFQRRCIQSQSSGRS